MRLLNPLQICPEGKAIALSVAASQPLWSSRSSKFSVDLVKRRGLVTVFSTVGVAFVVLVAAAFAAKDWIVDEYYIQPRCRPPASCE